MSKNTPLKKGKQGNMRLDNGGRIDRNKPVSFRFDGKTFGGFEGDTLASALLANGVHLVRCDHPCGDAGLALHAFAAALGQPRRT